MKAYRAVDTLATHPKKQSRFEKPDRQPDSPAALLLPCGDQSLSLLTTHRGPESPR